MKYYKNKLTPERQKWWESLTETEQYLRTCAFRLEKFDKSEQKSLLNNKLNYPGMRLLAKRNIRGLKVAIKAIKREFSVKGYWIRGYESKMFWCCGCCQQIIPKYSEYCPHCGQRVID